MDLYNKVSYGNSRSLALSYSTSFGLSSRLFSKRIQPHIYAIYGLVRIADEIVDTYKGPDSSKLLDDLETNTYDAVKSGYSTNPIVHSFALTAREYKIDESLIAPFFTSMRMDLDSQDYDERNYKKYIYGSAEVVGLMCLKVFCEGDTTRYDKLKEGASALGAAYQKVNFLRDMSSDYVELGRLYFPGVTFDDFNESAKRTIIDDIENDFSLAYPSLRQLPRTARTATMLSYEYYSELLKKLKRTRADDIKKNRVRVSDYKKIVILIKVVIREKLRG